MYTPSSDIVRDVTSSFFPVFLGGSTSDLILVFTGFSRVTSGRETSSVSTRITTPRNRPWYVSATSGPKDIVMVLDASLSMRQGDR